MGPMFVAPNRQDRDICTEANKLEKSSYVTAVAHPNTVIPARLCSVAHLLSPSHT
jgi:hypothetical protein